MAFMIDDFLFIVILLFSFMLLMFFILIYFDMRSAKKSIIWMFESDKLIRSLSSHVKDGMVQVGKKLFYVDKNVPPSMATGIIIKSLRPVYVFKHNQPVPLKITEQGVKAEQSPENLKNFRENKTLEQLLTVKTEGMSLIALAVGLLIGGLGMYVMIASKVIQIG